MPRGLAKIADLGGARRAQRETPSFVPENRALLARSGQATLLTAADGTLHFANSAAARILGYEAAALHGVNWQTWLHQADAELLRETLDKLRRQPESYGTCEVRLRDGQGHWRFFEISLTNLLDDGTGWLVQLRDITQQHEAGEHSRHQEALFAEAQRLASLGIWEWNIETDRMVWSEELFHIIGLRAGENALTFDTLLSCIHIDDRERVAQAAQRSVRERRTLDVQYRIVRPSGSVRIVHCRARAVVDSNARVVRLSGIAQDVTEALRADNQLRESEARFRRIVDSNIIGIVSWNSQGRITEANDAFLKIVGYTRADMREGHIHWNELTPPEFREADSLALQELAARGACQPYRKEYLRKDGTRVPILIGATYLEPNSGLKTNPGSDLGICFVLDMSRYQADSTHKLSAEDVLRENDRLYREGIAALPHGVLVHRNGVVHFANAVAAKTLGVGNVAELTGRSLLDFMHRDARGDVNALLKGTLTWPSFEKDSSNEPLTLRLSRLDGALLEVQAISTPILFGGQAAVQTVLFNQAPHTAHHDTWQHEHFRALVENTTDALSIVDGNGIIVYQSPVGEALTGSAGHEHLGASWLEQVHPEDQSRVAHLWEEIALAAGQTRTLQYRLHRGDGSWRPVETAGRLLPADAPYQGILLATRDITGRDVQSRWNDASDQLQAGDVFPSLYLRLDTEGMILACHTNGNFVGAERFLLTEQVFGRRVQELLPAPASGAIAVAIAEVARTRRAVCMEYELNLAGATHRFEARLQPLLDAQIIAIVRDVNDVNETGHEFDSDFETAGTRPIEVILLSEALKAACQRLQPAPSHNEVLAECENGALEVLARRDELENVLDEVLGKAIEASQAGTRIRIACEARLDQSSGAGQTHLHGRVRVRFSGQGTARQDALDALQETLAAMDASVGAEIAAKVFVFWLDLPAARML